MIGFTKSHLHLNYFLALEADLARVSRYVEFCQANLGVFSIELAHLLLSAASEVEVMAKCVCKQLQPSARPDNINKYRSILHSAVRTGKINDLTGIQVAIPRYGMTFTPWENWFAPKNPDWWKSYNNVKHQRDAHFNEATLQHAVNAVAGLLILNYIYYRIELKLDGAGKGPAGMGAVFKILGAAPSLIELPPNLPRPANP
jgi:hypothetical protein